VPCSSCGQGVYVLWFVRQDGKPLQFACAECFSMLDSSVRISMAKKVHVQELPANAEQTRVEGPMLVINRDYLLPTFGV